MSASKYFAPYCIKPLYLIDSQDNAGNCGFVNGLVYSSIFTITIILAGIKFYSSEKDDTRRRWILYGMFIVLSLLWILTPLILYSSYKTIWEGYNNAKKDLQAQGYSKMDILNILQLFEQNSAPLNVAGVGGIAFAKGQSSPENTNISSDRSKGGNGGVLKLSDH
ncbi:MAG: hypothetical protein PHG66_04580 [Candidatus Colwellbacteria bacterium]|nr:hypothetical protein [Candidatus Colwellbacteria bacterium]